MRRAFAVVVVFVVVVVVVAVVAVVVVVVVAVAVAAAPAPAAPAAGVGREARRALRTMLCGRPTGTIHQLPMLPCILDSPWAFS